MHLHLETTMKSAASEHIDLRFSPTAEEEEPSRFAVGDVLTAQWIEEIRLRADKEPWNVLTLSKYFSRLKRVDDYLTLVDSLAGLWESMVEADERHVAQLEEAKLLFVRWYCYGERSDGLKEALRTHVLGSDFGNGTQNLSAANAQAKLHGLGMWQYLPIEVQKSVQSLREMRHHTGSYGVMYLAPMIAPCLLEQEPARFLGLQLQPVDFVHYAQPDARPYIDFREEQIKHIATKTLAFATQVLTQWHDAEAQERARRELKAANGIRLRVKRLRQERLNAGRSGWDESEQVAQQLLATLDHAAQLKSSFMSFTVGWLRAVDHAFKRHL